MDGIGVEAAAVDDVDGPTGFPVVVVGTSGVTTAEVGAVTGGFDAAVTGGGVTGLAAAGGGADAVVGLIVEDGGVGGLATGIGTGAVGAGVGDGVGTLEAGVGDGVGGVVVIVVVAAVVVADVAVEFSSGWTIATDPLGATLAVFNAVVLDFALSVALIAVMLPNFFFKSGSDPAVTKFFNETLDFFLNAASDSLTFSLMMPSVLDLNLA